MTTIKWPIRFPVLLMAAMLATINCDRIPSVVGPPDNSSARASMTYEIWQGGIPGCGGPACDGPVFKLNPNADGTFTVQMDRGHAIRVYFNHPGISGRRIQGEIIATLPIFGGQDRMSSGFNESPPARVMESGGSFSIWGGNGGTAQVTIMLRFTESGPDMVSSPLNQDIGLRTVPRQ
ncbi:MAG: hypothetical protein AAB479_03210 [Patescibacteria group bacterium]